MIAYQYYIKKQLITLGSMTLAFIGTKYICTLLGWNFYLNFNDRDLLLSVITFVVVGAIINYYNDKK